MNRNWFKTTHTLFIYDFFERPSNRMAKASIEEYVRVVRTVRAKRD